MKLTNKPFIHLIPIALLSIFTRITFSDELLLDDNAATGIVQGPSVGFDSRIAVGHNRAYNQSPYGATFLFLQPTSVKSHIRLIAGVPLFRSDVIKNQVKNRRPRHLRKH